MITFLLLLIKLAEAVDVVIAYSAVWGPVLLSAGLVAAGWRLRPRGGRHRMPCACCERVRTVAGAVRTVASTAIRSCPDGRADESGVSPVTCADGCPVASADGRLVPAGHEDGDR